MKFPTWPLRLAALTILLPITHAVPEFSNHGTLTGWSPSPPKPEASGTVQQVTNVVYRGDSALKMTQTYLGTGYTGRYHSEAVYPNGYRRGDTKFYGFAFRLSESWDFSSQNFNIGQWIADFSDTGCDDYSPTSMIWVNGNTLYSRIKTGKLISGQPCSQNVRSFVLQTNIQPGTWYKLTFQVTWKSDATGQFKAWVNGSKVHEEYNIPTTLDDDGRLFSFRVGLYANSWHDDHAIAGSQTTRQVWIDEVGVGSEFKDADPDRL